MLKQSSPSRCIGTIRPCRSAAELRAARPFPPSLVASPCRQAKQPRQAQQTRRAQRWPAECSKGESDHCTRSRHKILGSLSPNGERAGEWGCPLTEGGWGGRTTLPRESEFQREKTAPGFLPFLTTADETTTSTRRRRWWPQSRANPLMEAESHPQCENEP